MTVRYKSIIDDSSTSNASAIHSYCPFHKNDEPKVKKQIPYSKCENNRRAIIGRSYNEKLKSEIEKYTDS